MLDSEPEAEQARDRLALPSAYDELRDSHGNLRPIWDRYWPYMAELGTAEAKARWSKAKQMLQEIGASYTIGSDRPGTERPWRISPIPLLIGSADWLGLCKGIVQRARLLSTLLADLYGAQRTLADGDLPCELVFDNPRFLRAIQGTGHPHTSWVPLYGVDLIRAPDGAFLVRDDCTQSPSGIGYALENRIVVTHALPDVLRHCNVERLGLFFRRLADGLRRLARHDRDNPRIALLTPGPYSTTYFEQAYLARYLGLTLVQGQDLTVRDNRLYLKTLGGLQAIDVLVRRVFDDFCDPLELRPESELGVPGLVHAIRSGNVSLVNPLGTGLLETTAFSAYLPGLCKKLLGEQLLLESVPTYYCGDTQQLKSVLADFENMVVLPTFSTHGPTATFVHQLSSRDRCALRDRIRHAPERYVAQRVTPASKAPAISEGEIRGRAVALRCFASCENRHDYHVMPGGLALVATRDDELVVSLERGARSKDVWVISDDEDQDGFVTPPSNPALELTRVGGDLPSRIADNLYWLGRYAERAESLSRLTRAIGALLLECLNDRDASRNSALTRLLETLRAWRERGDAPPTLALGSHGDCERECFSSVIDRGCANSVVSVIASTQRVSRLVRDRFSPDAWHILSSLDGLVHRFARADATKDTTELVDVLNQVIIALAAFSGLVMESMTRGLAWRFLDMGRRIERSLGLVTLLRASLVDDCKSEGALIEALLDVVDSGMTYRRRYPARMQTAPAVDLILADESNPRGLIFQLKTIEGHVNALPPVVTQGVSPKLHRLVLMATSQIELSDVQELCHIDESIQRRAGLRRLLDQLGELLPQVSDSLTETYLNHAQAASQLRGGGGQTP